MATTNNNVITPESLKQEDPLNLLPKPTDTTNYQGIIGGVYDSILGEYNTLNENVKAGENVQANTGNEILTIMNELTGKTGASQVADETAGVNKAREEQTKYAQQLADLNSQASILNREAQAIPLQVQEQFKNTGATDRGVAPVETGKLRENAIRALSIAQQSDIASAALTGSTLRLESAKAKAQQIIDLKYKPLEETLALKEKQYTLNRDILDKFDKKRSEALALQIDKEKTALAEKKKKEEDITKMITDATPNAPANVIANAKAIKERGGSALEVAQSLGKYGGDYLKTELLKQQIETEKAQRSNIYANKKKTEAETALLGTDAGKPATQAQLTAAGYANRIVQSKDNIDANIPDLKKLSLVDYKLQRNLPNALQSPLVQKQLQAERNFVNAVLRRESGAAISDTEFENATKQYFPMPGDSEAVLKQKKANRDLTSQNVIKESGTAYTSSPVDEYFNFATGSIQTVNNKVNNKEDAFLMSLPK